MDINWFPGHMAKTLRQLKDFLKQVDLVIETCDARIPESSRNPELQKQIGKMPVLLVLNKADLADKTVTRQWIEWYREQGIKAMSCDSLRRSGLNEIKRECQNMTKDKYEKARARGRLFRPLRIMVAGIPNTGKSTLINGLSGKRVAKTADKPGVTRSISWIRTGGHLELLDSPGLLWPKLGSDEDKLKLAATGAIKDELLPVEEVCALLLVKLAKQYPDLIRNRYRLEELDRTGEELLDDACRKRGYLLSGGKLDTLRFATQFLDELRGGKIGRISLEQPAEIMS